MEPEPGTHQGAGFPQDKDGRNDVGNVHGIFITFYCLEKNVYLLASLFATLIDFDQPGSPDWVHEQIRATTTHFCSQAADCRSRIVFIRRGREYGYRNGGPASIMEAVGEPWGNALPAPEGILYFPEWEHAHPGQSGATEAGVLK